jgi:hypothetical protein
MRLTPSPSWEMTSGTPPALQLFQVLKACNRISYRKLGVLRTHFSSVPIIALTATCPTSVRRDIHKSLQLASPMLNAHSELHFCCIPVPLVLNMTKPLTPRAHLSSPPLLTGATSTLRWSHARPPSRMWVWTSVLSSRADSRTSVVLCIAAMCR